MPAILRDYSTVHSSTISTRTPPTSEGIYYTVSQYGTVSIISHFSFFKVVRSNTALLLPTEAQENIITLLTYYRSTAENKQRIALYTSQFSGWLPSECPLKPLTSQTKKKRTAAAAKRIKIKKKQNKQTFNSYLLSEHSTLVSVTVCMDVNV